jgi:antitoxin component YwqK of YwqJK toxin-antitoxin module
MLRIFSLLILLLFLSASCNDNLEQKGSLKKIQILNSKNEKSNTFYLNPKNQKDSIEEVYETGKLQKRIFWKNGVVDSVVQIEKSKKDSIFKEYDKNKSLVRKSTIDESGKYEGISVQYKDSLISTVSNYIDGEINGLVVNLNEKEYPQLVGRLIDNSFYFGIQFYDNGTVKSLRVNDKNTRLGIIYNYYPNQSIKSKVELLDGKAEGIRYEYDEAGNILSKKKLKKGIIDRD